MIFITGPLFAGKKEYAKAALHLTDDAFARVAVWDVEQLAASSDDLTALADRLAQSDVVIATEIGGGVVPMEASARLAREKAGQLAQLLAARAQTVIRVCCGLPQLLKGELPC
ncbi:MAG: bifunctional adenosylcobinamide kinase/adenosylcobinamide-phosphate guanylyltransferase [Oscillospiraceae bacterium]